MDVARVDKKMNYPYTSATFASAVHLQNNERISKLEHSFRLVAEIDI
jgi:hypothetical protein